MIRISGDGILEWAGKPRASGDDPEYADKTVYGLDVNPARAGMIRVRGQDRLRAGRKPRASGDDPSRP